MFFEFCYKVPTMHILNLFKFSKDKRLLLTINITRIHNEKINKKHQVFFYNILVLLIHINEWSKFLINVTTFKKH